MKHGPRSDRNDDSDKRKGNQCVEAAFCPLELDGADVADELLALSFCLFRKPGGCLSI